MGGNALKDFGVTRLNKEEYHLLSGEITATLSKKIPDMRFNIIPSYNSKDSFGDMDILYSGNYYEDIINTFKPIAKINNGGCLSITYPFNDKLFQIDFIKVKPEEYNFALHYFSYNDLGNLCGRLYKKMGLKFGHNGLFYILRNPNKDTQIIKELLITRDWDYAISLVKLPEYNGDNFNNLSDIFDYVIQSPYFNKDIFLLENRNHISRIRDRKRLTYMLFLQYIKHKNNLPNFDWQNTNKQEFLTKCLIDFPEFNKDYHKTLADFYYHEELHKKYNGDLIREWIGLEGKELGNFIKSIKSFISDEFVEKNSSEDIKTLVKKLYADYLMRNI